MASECQADELGLEAHKGPSFFLFCRAAPCPARRAPEQQRQRGGARRAQRQVPAHAAWQRLPLPRVQRLKVSEVLRVRDRYMGGRSGARRTRPYTGAERSLLNCRRLSIIYNAELQ